MVRVAVQGIVDSKLLHVGCMEAEGKEDCLAYHDNILGDKCSKSIQIHLNINHCQRNLDLNNGYISLDASRIKNQGSECPYYLGEETTLMA